MSAREVSAWELVRLSGGKVTPSQAERLGADGRALVAPVWSEIARDEATAARMHARLDAVASTLSPAPASSGGPDTVNAAARAYLAATHDPDEAVGQFIRARYGTEARWNEAIAAEAGRLAALPGHDGAKGQALTDRASWLCWDRAMAELRGLANALRPAAARQ